ncbi:MAG TPA: S-layer homology domain-containing protein, partial [Paenibacillus sp.]|nr:S-layer homology domain-containing protein [Paenibacillus sp.]
GNAISSVHEASAPEAKVTRAQFAALLVRALGLTERTGDGTFADVASGAWYAGAAEAASEAGLATGFEDGTFRPDAAITREQMAVMIGRAIEAAGRQAPAASAEGALHAFGDASAISSWARSAVAASAEAGIVRGGADATFRPAGLATRAESAAMLKRLLQYVEFID